METSTPTLTRTISRGVTITFAPDEAPGVTMTYHQNPNAKVVEVRMTWNWNIEKGAWVLSALRGTARPVLKSGRLGERETQVDSYGWTNGRTRPEWLQALVDANTPQTRMVVEEREPLASSL